MLDCHPLFTFEGILLKELQKRGDALALQLLKKGIKQGDRIAYLLPPSVDLIALFFASVQLGTTLAPLSRYLPMAQIESSLERLDAKLFIDSFPIQHDVRKINRPPFTTPSFLFFTSGSTATPKIALLPLRALLANARSAIAALSLSPTDCYHLSLPLYHVGGMAIFFRALLSGASIVLSPSNPAITHISFVPTQLQAPLPQLPKLRAILMGGAPIPSITPPHLPLLFSYGLTEMGSLTALGAPSSPYIPLPGKEMRLSPDGEIFVRGDSLFSGYFTEETLISPFDPDGWFATGDLGKPFKKGFVITGRKDWQFISGGENIQPEEIEKILLSFPEIDEAVILPEADPKFGARPIALLVGRPLSTHELQNRLAGTLPKFKIPISFSFVDSLPKKGMKIDRKTLLYNFAST